MTADVERVARAICLACNLDPDAISPKAAQAGHSIPEWVFFVPAATAAMAATRLIDAEALLADEAGDATGVVLWRREAVADWLQQRAKDARGGGNASV